MFDLMYNNKILLQKQKYTRCVIVICLINIFFASKSYAMQENYQTNIECADPYIVSEIEKKIFGPNGPKIATELVNQLPKNKYVIKCWDKCHPVYCNHTWYHFEKEVLANITQKLASLKKEYETIDLSSININDDNTAYTINAYERALKLSKTIGKFTEKKYALVNYIIETYLVSDLKPHIIKHGPHLGNKRISLYNMGHLLQWSFLEGDRNSKEKIFNFDALYKKNWIRFTQTFPKQPFYFDETLSINFRILKNIHSPNCIWDIEKKITSMDIVSVKELTEKEMNKFKRSKMITKGVWKNYFNAICSNHFKWYVEKPQGQLNKNGYYNKYDQTLLEQNYYLDDFYKEKLTKIITLYYSFRQPLENNQIDLNKKIMKQMPGVNQKYLDIIDIVMPTLKEEEQIFKEKKLANYIYKKTKLAIDEFCIGSYKHRKENINNVADMIYTKKVTERVLPYLAQEIDYLTVFRDSSAQSPDNAVFICADWFKQQ